MTQLVESQPVESAAELRERYGDVRRRLWAQPRFAQKPEPKDEPTVVEQVRKALEDTPEPPPEPTITDEAVLIRGRVIRVLDIICAAAEHFNVKKLELLSHRRNRATVRRRQIVMYLSRELTTRSLPEIGRLLGGKDHTTVLHAIRKVEELIQAGDPWAADVEAIRARLA